MAYQVISPQFGFIQFSESDYVDSLSNGSALSCLPVYEDNDIAFQAIIRGLEAEAGALCGAGSALIRIGLVQECGEDFLMEFAEKPQLFKINTTDVVMNWPHGLPDFTNVISVNDCFRIKLLIDDTPFCSNCLTRIRNDRYTAVVEYGSEENSFGFNYCGGTLVGDTEQDVDCEPLFVQFFNQSTLSIPYTAALKNKYGDAPTVSVWIYNENGELQKMGISETLDAYPPNNLNFDFGGSASGIIKIS